MPEFVRYDDEALAWEYDQRQPAPFPGELEWHLKYASAASPPMLEYACGSGRLTIPMARAGCRVDGVDRSATMLARLGNRLAVCDKETRERVQLFRADMMAFAPETAYGLIAVPYNSLQYLETSERIAAFFFRVYCFLKPGGRFIFVVRRVTPTDYVEYEHVIYDWLHSPVVDPETGVSVGSRMTAHFDPTLRQVVSSRTYHIVSPDGNKRVVEMTSRAPIITVSEYVSLLTTAGFAVSIFSSYDERPDDGLSREVCFVCSRLT